MRSSRSCNVGGFAQRDNDGFTRKILEHLPSPQEGRVFATMFLGRQGGMVSCWAPKKEGLGENRSIYMYLLYVQGDSRRG